MDLKCQDAERGVKMIEIPKCYVKVTRFRIAYSGRFSSRPLAVMKYYSVSLDVHL
jgi:hypothetical protein